MSNTGQFFCVTFLFLNLVIKKNMRTVILLYYKDKIRSHGPNYMICRVLCIINDIIIIYYKEKNYCYSKNPWSDILKKK